MQLKTNFVEPDVSLELRLYGKYFSFLRRHPIHAVRLLFGIIIPPHEGAMLETAWDGYKMNIYTCSRGTSKSFTIGSLFPPIKALLFKNVSTLVASASKFRGGKLVLTDTSRLLRGSLKSQKVGNNWGMSSLQHRAVTVKKDPDMWHIDFTSNSNVYTIPTSNEESVRGMRANILIIDERNVFDGLLIQRVYLPFLAVGSDFENPAKGSDENQVFYVGTIDYTYRDWFKEIAAVQDLAKLQFQLQQYMLDGNWTMYDRLMNEHGYRLRNASVSLTRYDYTDLLIPTQIENYKVNYPGATPGKQIKYDERDKIELIYTYPVDKRQIEGPLDEGIIDRESWAAEHRNQFIQADGNVYPYDLIETVTGPIYTLSEEKSRGWNSELEGYRYAPPVLWECSDPCVLGVDIARTQDFVAFVVIRIGPMAKGEYSLKTHMGESPWSNVIWAEQHQQMTIKEITEKIREYRSRYNIVCSRTCPGICMDARGGGANVRDELVVPSPPVDPENGLPVVGWTPPQIIYDPLDKEDRFGKDLTFNSAAWGGLRLLYTTDTMNSEYVGFTKGQMQTNKLYVGSSKAKNFVRDPENKMYVGYVGLDVLKHQLLRIQAVLTPLQKNVRYEMPGDTTRIENKKDLFMSFLYCGAALREWLTTVKEEKAPPVAYAEAFFMNRQRRGEFRTII
jgi:hypothetical protein